MPSSPQHDSLAPYRKAPFVLFLVGATLAASGFFMGLRQNKDFSEKNQSEERYAAVQKHSESSSDTKTLTEQETPPIPEITEYWNLVHKQLQPNVRWFNTVKNLPPPRIQPTPTEAPSDAEKYAALRLRLTRRAYEGAPPTVPHPVEQRTAASCLACHGQDIQIENRLIPKMSHPVLDNCLQCHVSDQGLGFKWNTHHFGLKVDNTFEGKARSGEGSTAYAGAPPMIPHTTLMRENCMSCHGEGRPQAIVTPHPERQSCTQCHAPNAELDQRAFRSPTLR